MGEHKLAGTVVLFGQQDVGMLASKLERQSPEWNAEERELRVPHVVTNFSKARAKSPRQELSAPGYLASVQSGQSFLAPEH
jgi:hypothetical protein